MSFIQPRAPLRLCRVVIQRSNPPSALGVRHIAQKTSSSPGSVPYWKNEPNPENLPSESMRGTGDGGDLVPAESKEVGAVPSEYPVHQPNYDAPVDHGTSTFSIVPKRIQDGSEDVLPAGLFSGAPIDLQARQVRIHKQARPSTQSGGWHGHFWRMDWDIIQKGHRWENPLMGWQSSADCMQGTHLNFKSKEDAIAFANKQGYEYFVQEPNERRFTPKAYANNFMHEPKKLKNIRTK